VAPPRRAEVPLGKHAGFASCSTNAGPRTDPRGGRRADVGPPGRFGGARRSAAWSTGRDADPIASGAPAPHEPVCRRVIRAHMCSNPRSASEACASRSRTAADGERRGPRSSSAMSNRGPSPAAGRRSAAGRTTYDDPCARGWSGSAACDARCILHRSRSPVASRPCDPDRQKVSTTRYGMTASTSRRGYRRGFTRDWTTRWRAWRRRTGRSRHRDRACAHVSRDRERLRRLPRLAENENATTTCRHPLQHLEQLLWSRG